MKKFLLFKWQWLVRGVSPLTLATIVGTTALSWLGITTVAPPVVRAELSKVDLVLARQDNESYETMIERALAVARATAQNVFDSNILITDVKVNILGENAGEKATILVLEVSRQSWRQQPDPQRWATFFPASRTLLGFDTGGEETTGEETTSEPSEESPPPNDGETQPGETMSVPDPDEEAEDTEQPENPLPTPSENIP